VNFGDTGWGEVGGSLAVKYFSPTTRLCIIRVARGEAARTTWAALVLLDSIGNNDGDKVVPHVIHVSGTLKHAQIAAIEWNREAIARVRAGAGTQSAISQHASGSVTPFQSSMQEIEELQD